MLQDKYLQNSIGIMNYPYYASDSLVHLQLRKPAFLCGDSRLLENQKSKRTFYAQNGDYQSKKLTESTRFRLNRIQKNPFLKSHYICPKITNLSSSQQPQKLQVSEKQKYIINKNDRYSKYYDTSYNYLPTYVDKIIENGKEKTQLQNTIQTVGGSNAKKTYIQTQKPVKDQSKSVNIHFTAQRSPNYNVNSRYLSQQIQKQDKQVYSQMNQKEYEFKDYLPFMLEQRNTKSKSQNQTIIQRLDENTNQFNDDLYRGVNNQRRQERDQKLTATFINNQTNYGEIIGAITSINNQGQLKKKSQNGKAVFPEQITLGKMTYYSVKIE